MKTIKRLAVGQLNELDKLQRGEMGDIIGGYGGDGNCYFNCLEYLNKKYECREGWTYEDYANDYVTGKGNKYDDWDGTARGSNDEGVDNGPQFVDWDNSKLNAEPFNYLANCFDTEGSKWVLTGNNLSSYFNNQSSDENDTIVGTFLVGDPGSGVTHCVIFTGYDEKSSNFFFYDPTSNTIGSVNSSRVICGAKVKGCK